MLQQHGNQTLATTESACKCVSVVSGNSQSAKGLGIALKAVTKHDLTCTGKVTLKIVCFLYIGSSLHSIEKQQSIYL